MGRPWDRRLEERRYYVSEAARRFEPSDDIRKFAGTLTVRALVGGSGVGKEYHGKRALEEMKQRGPSLEQRESGLIAVHGVRHFTSRGPRHSELAVPELERPYAPFFDLKQDHHFWRLLRMMRGGDAVQVYPHPSRTVYGSLRPSYDEHAVNVAEYTGDQCLDFAEGGYFGDFSMTYIVQRNLKRWDEKLLAREGTLPPDYDARLLESRRSLGLALAHPALVACTNFVLNDYGAPWEDEAPEPPAYLIVADSYAGGQSQEFIERQIHNREVATEIFGQLSMRMGLEPDITKFNYTSAA